MHHGVSVHFLFIFYFTDFSEVAIAEPEVSAVMNWTMSHKFVTSVALQGGAFVAKYPLNKPKPQGISRIFRSGPDAEIQNFVCQNERSSLDPPLSIIFMKERKMYVVKTCDIVTFSGGAWLTPDQSVFKDLAVTYVKYHSEMSEKQLSPCTNQPGTITNFTMHFSMFAIYLVCIIYRSNLTLIYCTS